MDSKSTIERRKIINELQKLAESVLTLKSKHRQRRPIVIEFSGSPKAGKTSCINSLELFLKRNGFTVQIIQERASVCPVIDKQSPMFNIWTSCMSLAGLIGTLEGKTNKVDVLILDRGIFDALCWFEWLVSTSKMDEAQRIAIENFILMEEFVKNIDIVFAFYVKPNISIDREYAYLLTDKKGSIMNEKVLSEYLKAIHHTIENKKDFFHKVFKIDTSEKNQDEVGKEVTSITLETLKDLLMERIGYFTPTNQFYNMFNNCAITPYSIKEKSIPLLKFDLRDNVENNSQLIQPIPIAVITNNQKNKVLVVKKKNSAVSRTSPEKNKSLIYIGGHSRFEDKTNTNKDDFISICKTTLKREVQEEIGISIALNKITPTLIYSKKSDSSLKHLAVCFFISVDEDSIKFRLDSDELISNRGKSKSGKFVKIDEILQYDLEEWSKLILKYYFNISFDEQMSLY